jgi:hypothetical protein
MDASGRNTINDGIEIKNGWGLLMSGMTHESFFFVSGKNEIDRDYVSV